MGLTFSLTGICSGTTKPADRLAFKASIIVIKE